MRLPLALTMPAVTVDDNENGFPTAITHSPTCTFLELPKRYSRQIRFIYFNYCKISGGIRSDQFSRINSLVIIHFNTFCRFDHVIVGYDVTIGGKNNA